MKKTKFKINLEIVGSERNIMEFMTMVKYIEYLGKVGHSADFNISVDGDGAGQLSVNLSDYKKNENERIKKQIKERVKEYGDYKNFNFE